MFPIRPCFKEVHLYEDNLKLKQHVSNLSFIKEDRLPLGMNLSVCVSISSIRCMHKVHDVFSAVKTQPLRMISDSPTIADVNSSLLSHTQQLEEGGERGEGRGERGEGRGGRGREGDQFCVCLLFRAR